jgi:hypothetical protein
MTQTKDFNFVIRLVDDLTDGGILYYFIHKFERNKDISFNEIARYNYYHIVGTGVLIHSKSKKNL